MLSSESIKRIQCYINIRCRERTRGLECFCIGLKVIRYSVNAREKEHFCIGSKVIRYSVNTAIITAAKYTGYSSVQSKRNSSTISFLQSSSWQVDCLSFLHVVCTMKCFFITPAWARIWTPALTKLQDHPLTTRQQPIKCTHENKLGYGMAVVSIMLYL